MYKLETYTITKTQINDSLLYDSILSDSVKAPSLLQLLFIKDERTNNPVACHDTEEEMYSLSMENMYDILEINPKCTVDVHTYLIKTLAKTSEEFLEAYLPINPKRFFE